MTSVFVIESGSYSDRHIYGIFSTKELAEEHEKFVPESSGVQEWPLDTIKESDYDDSALLICMLKDGSVDHMYNSFYSPAGFEEYKYDDEMLCWSVATTDVTKAVKVVNEKRIQILAMNLWGNEEDTRKYFNV